MIGCIVHPSFRRNPGLVPLFCLALAACGNSGEPRAGDYIGGTTAVECAPFARALTGVSLTGAAADWWSQADGRYARIRQPVVGSVLVFRRSARLPYGHVAVVSRVLSGRQIMVTQANWVHHRVTEDQPVLDVSETGDWSLVRVWWPPSGQIGLADYPIHGFIRPDHPTEHDRLVAETPAAIRLAAGR
ncbi:MAG TPA: CHAP domain-containing protein [Rhodopila sp.]